jgi:hypothetical protein
MRMIRIRRGKVSSSEERKGLVNCKICILVSCMYLLGGREGWWEEVGLKPDFISFQGETESWSWNSNVESVQVHF